MKDIPDDGLTATRQAIKAWTMRNTNAQIHNLLYEALEAIDAPLDLLQIVGSWGDTMPESETIEQLMAFISAAKSGSKDDGKNS